MMVITTLRGCKLGWSKEWIDVQNADAECDHHGGFLANDNLNRLHNVDG